jgi:putative membrane protein
MTWLAATASLIALVLCQSLPAAAQTPAAGGRPATPDPGGAKLNDADRNFIHGAATGGMAEVELGKLAGSKGQSDPVKEFGHRMVEDHSKIDEQLAVIAKEAGATPPTQLDDEHKAIQKQLEGLSGPAFDRAYIDSQVGEHQTAVQLFEWEVDAGDNARLKSFAAATLPILFRHLEMARDVQTRTPLVAAAPPQSGSSPSPAPARPAQGK